ncbi:hypothetical protein MKW92_027726 [Papaver armeniacum]|nr:hypothetical protein MKW92_027726 [Papaver armeniacum]
MATKHKMLHLQTISNFISKPPSTVSQLQILRLLFLYFLKLQEVLGKMGVPPMTDLPVIAPNNIDDIWNDGSSLQSFSRNTRGLGRTKSLAGKPAGIFYSTGSQGSGQETTTLTAITQLVHHGLIYFPIGYTFEAWIFKMVQVKGGVPYGARIFAGYVSRQPNELEIGRAFHLGSILLHCKELLDFYTLIQLLF